MLKGFKEFVLRGNVVDLAVAVVIGAAFGAVVTAFVKDLITPLIAAIFGKPDFSSLSFTINSSTFLYGEFINAVIAFVLIAAAVYFVVVAPMNALAARGPRVRTRRPESAPSASARSPSAPGVARTARRSSRRQAPRDRLGPGRGAPRRDTAAYWDGRYRADGEIWGDRPSELVDGGRGALADNGTGGGGPHAARPGLWLRA